MWGWIDLQPLNELVRLFLRLTYGSQQSLAVVDYHFQLPVRIVELGHNVSVVRVNSRHWSQDWVLPAGLEILAYYLLDVSFHLREEVLLTLKKQPLQEFTVPDVIANFWFYLFVCRLIVSVATNTGYSCESLSYLRNCLVIGVIIESFHFTVVSINFVYFETGLGDGPFVLFWVLYW